MMVLRSSLVSTAGGRHLPQPVILAYFILLSLLVVDRPRAEKCAIMSYRLSSVIPRGGERKGAQGEQGGDFA